MAEIHRGATLSPSKVDLVADWIGAQRWYAAKGTVPQLTRVGSWRLDDPQGAVGVETLYLRDESAAEPVIYQVPLTYRDAPLEGALDALVGLIEHSVLGTRWVYDAPHDPVYAEQLLALVRGQVRAASSSIDDAIEEGVVGSPHSAWDTELQATSTRVLAGEQSNTSIIVEARTPSGQSRPVIIKVFRMLAAGANPDVDLQGALRAAGCERVPAVVGSVRGQWPLPDSDGPAFADLAFAQEFLPGVEDAWRVAIRAVDEGGDFTGPARALGAATAEVHAGLADSLGTEPTTAQTGSSIIAQMAERFAAAVAEVPELERYAPLISAIHARAAQETWPPMQRIHGDYHLGQVLHSAQRGWILLDFEGEPLRPLAERSLPDQWIRDVAGMLRSIDYAGGSWEQDNPGSARAWVTSTQQAFLDGYADRSGDDPRDHDSLLTAFEVDKAMYELVYEARNRPDWVDIPLAAIDRLSSGVAAATTNPTGHTDETEPHR